MKSYRIFALFSGGLDSIISVKLMQSLGYEVIPVFMETPFFKPEAAIKSAKKNNLNLEIFDISESHMAMLLNPKYGYGKYINPCIDCHGLMFKELANRMEEYHIDFIISGEVLSQRPMSQRKDSMNSVSKISGVRDLIVRPLSQKLLVPTLPIREGWINIDDMLDIQGRSRKRQIALAKKMGIEYYPSANGGCALTIESFSLKLKDLIDHDMFSREDIELLHFGRHFRLSENCKLIIGRNQIENYRLETWAKNHYIMHCKDYPGPLGILCSRELPTEQELTIAASILIHFSTRIQTEKAVILYGQKKPENDILPDLKKIPIHIAMNEKAEKFVFINEIEAAKQSREFIESFWIDENKKWIRTSDDSELDEYEN
ncbi:MAG: hypothetical protein PHR06_12615 [Candidatus Cloacimonetes bacterium]|nr:hypothetical protein [Candidatus Cloacimonadota bacterium]